GRGRGQGGGTTADVGADARVARGAGGELVGFPIGHLRFRLNASIARCRPHGPASFLKVSRYSTSRSSTIALTSPERRKAARIPGRPTRISLRSIRATGSRLLLQCFELVDQALDHRQA